MHYLHVCYSQGLRSDCWRYQIYISSVTKLCNLENVGKLSLLHRALYRGKCAVEKDITEGISITSDDDPSVISNKEKTVTWADVVTGKRKDKYRMSSNELILLE